MSHPKKIIIKKVCAWCEKELSLEEEYAAQGVITHGICSLCALKATQYARRSAQEILDCMDEPVFVVDQDGVIRGTNSSGRKVLGGDIESIEGKLFGNALECSSSKMPGGCGKTVHCLACTLRNIITDTLVTGRNYEKVPAFEKVSTSNGEIIEHYLMSTERIGGFLLLRIDEVIQNNNQKAGMVCLC